MTTFEDLKKFCDSLNVAHDSNVESEDNEVRITIRNGKHDEPSQEAIREGRNVSSQIRNKFGDDVKINTEFIDEWVDITVRLK